MPTLAEEGSIEFLHESSRIACQLCPASLERLSPQQRQAHYETHFANESQSLSRGSNSNVHPKGGPKLRTGFLRKNVPPSEQNVFWMPTHSTAPPKNFTPGLIPILKRALLKTHAKGITTRAMLCHEGVTHVATESWDKGWGCGYRNFLMACTALLSQAFQPLYFPLLDSPIPPGVLNLQIWIENAWANGYDREGANQLGHALVGKNKWIGTAELYVAFVSRGIPVQLVDFPGSERGPKAVTEWVMNYFSPPVLEKGQTNAFDALKGASPVLCTERMPLILQHPGHSRIVVGIEVTRKGDTNLLIFDPSIQPRRSLRRAALAHHPSCSPSKNSDGSPSVPPGIVHPHSSKGTGRGTSGTLLDDAGREVKRAPAGDQPVTGKKDDVIVVNDSEDELDNGDAEVDESLDPTQTVTFFRVNWNKLGKNKKYQILWFPLEPPLEEDERWAHRVVTSEQVI